MPDGNPGGTDNPYPIDPGGIDTPTEEVKTYTWWQIALYGFGSFIVKERAEKTARNIAKNTTIKIPAHSIPAFKPSKEFTGKVK